MTWLELESKYAEIRAKCAARAIAYVKTLTFEERDLWSDYEDEGLRQAIINEDLETEEEEKHRGNQ